MTRTVAFAETDEELFREQMRSSAQGDGAHPKTFAYLLVKATETRVWERLPDPDGRPYRSFRDFLVAPDPYGLSMTVAELRHAVALAGDEATRAVETLLADETPQALSVGHKTKRATRDSRDDTESVGPASDTAERQLRRLKRDDPELAERVVKGEITANAAATAKGWRRPRIVVTSPERIAEHLRKYLTPEQRQTLARLLTEE